MVDADTHPSGVVREIVHAVWIGLAEFGDLEIMNAYDLGIAARPPLFALILEVSDQFFLFRVYGYDRLFSSLHSANSPTDMSKLIVPVGMAGTLPTLLVALKAVPLLVQ